MPYAFDVSLSVPASFDWIVILAVVLVVGFAAGRLSKKPEPQPLPTKADVEAMTKHLERWMELADAVSGWKAAFYGAVGVLLGAAGGLAADWVTSGNMSTEQKIRAAAVLGALTLTVLVVVFLLEMFDALDPIIKRLTSIKERGTLFGVRFRTAREERG